MYDELIQICSGISITQGTTAIVLQSTGRPMMRNPYDVLTNGQYVEYHMYHEDGISAGYEWGWGIYTDSTKQISRNPVYTSNVADAIVDWPDTDNKIVTIGVSKNSMLQFAATYASKPINEAIWAIFTGQSNAGPFCIFPNANEPSVTLSNTTRVYDLSTDGTGAFSLANLEWRLVDHTDQYIYETSAANVGMPRQYEFLSTWYTSVNQFFEACRLIAEITGRIVLTSNVWRNDTALDDATNGWVYDNGSDNALDRLATVIDNVQTGDYTSTMPPGWVEPAYPDFGGFAQGEKDMANGRVGYAWGNQMIGIFDSLEDSKHYGLLKKDMPWYIVEPAQSFRAKYPGFNGFEYLQENTGDHIRHVSTVGLTSPDAAHHSVYSALSLGGRISRMHCLPTEQTKSVSGIAAKREMLDPELNNVYNPRGTSFNYWWFWKDDSDTAPVTHSQFYIDATNGDRLFMSRTATQDVGAGGQTEVLTDDWLECNRDGFILTMTDQDGSGAEIVYTCEYIPQASNATYLEWAITNVSTTGTPVKDTMKFNANFGQHIPSAGIPAVQTDYYPAFNKLKAQEEWLFTDGGSMYLQFRDYKNLVLGVKGDIRRKGGITTVYCEHETTGNVTNETIGSIYFSDIADTCGYWKVRFFGQCQAENDNTTRNGVAYSEAEGVVYTGAAGVGWITEMDEQTNHVAQTGVTFDVFHVVFGITRLAVTVTGRAGQNWKWGAELEYYEFPL